MPPEANGDKVKVRLPHFAKSEAPDGRVSERDGSPGPHEPVSIDALQATMDFESEADCAAYVDRLSRLPRRELPLLVSEMPGWLAALDPTSDVRTFEHGQDSLHSAGALQRRIRDAIRRQAAGQFRPEEVAAAIASSEALTLKAARESIVRAFDEGRLPFWSSASPIDPMDPAEEAKKGGMHTLSYYGYTTPEAVNAWLDAADPQRRLPRMRLGMAANARAGELPAGGSGPRVPAPPSGLVYWRRRLYEQIAAIDRAHDGKASVLEAIEFLKALKDARLVTPTSRIDTADVLHWQTDQGAWEPVQKHTVANALSLARKWHAARSAAAAE